MQRTAYIWASLMLHLCGLLLCGLALNPSAARAAIPPTIKPGDVVFAANEIHRGLLALQENEGVETPKPLNIEVVRVSPREVYYQALLLQHKIQILRYERTGRRGQLVMAIPTGTIDSEHVMDVLRVANAQFNDTLATLKMDPVAIDGAENSNLSNNRAFKSIVRAMRAIDPLLKEQSIAPADVFQVVQRTLNRLQALRQKLGPMELPAKPEQMKASSSGAVFNGLRRSYVFIRRILVGSGLQAMALGEVQKGDARTPPGDALMMAQLLFGHVDALAREADSNDLLAGVYFPGPTTSANVYSLVHQLELLSWEMSERIKENPLWLAEPVTTSPDDEPNEPTPKTPPE